MNTEEIEIELSSKLICLEHNRTALAAIGALCQHCEMPVWLSASEYHTMSKIVVKNHPERPEWEEYFVCCNIECYKKADKAIEQQLMERCGSSLICVLEQWGDDE